MIASFLKGRTMRVKIGTTLSEKRSINGGSPQGCVSANALFCATIEALQTGELDCSAMDAAFAPEGSSSSCYAGETILANIPRFDRDVLEFEQNGWNVPINSPTSLMCPPTERILSPISPPSPLATSSPVSGLDESNLFTRPLQGMNPMRRVEDTRTPDHLPSQTLLNSFLGMPQGWVDWDLWFKKYIDDGLAGEKVCNINSISHVSSKKENKYVHASKSEHFMKLTIQNAHKIGMKINTSKTKMMCVNVAKNSVVNTYINIEGTTIEGGDEIKILGYKMGRELNASKQVSFIEKKFYSRLWTLRNLKKASFSETDLVKVYESYIRPVIEYCSVVYHPLLTYDMKKRLENLQLRALKTIYGNATPVSSIRKKTDLKPLADRRETAVRNFAVKTSTAPRFEKWYPKNNKRQLRNPETYSIHKSRYDRLKDGHLNAFRRILNEL